MLRSQSHTPLVLLLSSWRSKPLHTYILRFHSRRFSWARSAVHYGQSGGKGTSIGSGVFETATNLFISSLVFRKQHSAMKNHKLINHLTRSTMCFHQHQLYRTHYAAALRPSKYIFDAPSPPPFLSLNIDDGFESHLWIRSSRLQRVL